MSLEDFLRKDDFLSDINYGDFDQIRDLGYQNFIKTYGDGFYFNYSLHLYGCSENYPFHDLKKRNELVHHLFIEFISSDDVCFGEDLFGNQFIFYPDGVGMLTIETGEIEFIAKDFTGWLRELEEETDYYSGESLMLKWVKDNEIEPYERLTPKIPFVLGGEFNIENLYKTNCKIILEFNAYLAKQIRDLPDGETIVLKTQ